MKREQTDYIVIHCTATRPDQDIGVAEVDAMHRAKGWNGCGYHAVIKRDGLVEFGRHFDDVGAHVYGYNKVSVGVAMSGGVDKNGNAEDNFTGEQYLSLIEVVDMLKRSYPDAKTVGHRDLSPDIDGDGVVEEWEWLKQCPCFEVTTFFT